MHGSPNSLRVVWQFFEKDFMATDALKNPRNFSRFDEQYFTHFGLGVYPVRVVGFIEVLSRAIEVLAWSCWSPRARNWYR